MVVLWKAIPACLCALQWGCPSVLLKPNLMHAVRKIVCFGEIMLRLTPYSPHERLVKSPLLRMNFAGAESNVAVSLALLGHTTSFVTALPTHALGEGALNSLREYGVDTQFVARRGDRIGTYFVEQGYGLRSSEVIYDRAASAIAGVETGVFDWPAIFEGKHWFHLTGITPALSPSCAAVGLEAVKAAKAAGLRVSFDPNYRSKLWSKAAARATLPSFLPYVDVLITNVGAAADGFEIEPEPGEDGLEAAQSVTRKLVKLANFATIAMTIRDHASISENDYTGLVWQNNQFYTSRSYDLQPVERLGGGDAFAAGLIHGLCQGWDPQLTVDFATAAAAIKHTIPGDINLVVEAEVMRLVEGNLAGRVQR